jgi:hypothetical protein
MNDFKQQLEKKLGYEINNYHIRPKYTIKKLKDGVRIFSELDPYGEENWNDTQDEIDQLIGYDIFVEKKKNVEYIENKITILKSGYIKFE